MFILDNLMMLEYMSHGLTIIFLFEVSHNFEVFFSHFNVWFLG